MVIMASGIARGGVRTTTTTTASFLRGIFKEKNFLIAVACVAVGISGASAFGLVTKP